MGLERIIDATERERAHADVGYVDFYSEAVKQSEAFRKEYNGWQNVVKSKDMPLERSRDGLIKHIINEKMNTKEMCLDIYMQFIPPQKKSVNPFYRSSQSSTSLLHHPPMKPPKRP